MSSNVILDIGKRPQRRKIHNHGKYLMTNVVRLIRNGKVKWYIFIVIVNWSSTSVLIYKSHEYIWNMALSKSHSMCSRSTTDVSSCIKQYKLICSLEFTVLVQIQNLMKNTYNDNDSSLGIMATMSSCCNNSKLQESLAIMEQMRERRKN